MLGFFFMYRPLLINLPNSPASQRCRSAMALVRYLMFVPLFFAFGTAPAQASLKGCFERVYTNEHMAKNPKQFITSIQVQLGMELGNPDAGEAEQDIIALKTNRNGHLYYIGLRCTGAAFPLRCTTTTAPAGRVVIETTDAGVRMTFDTDVVAGEEGMGDEANITIQKGFDNGVFAVPRVSGGLCTYFLKR
jgi:hypothetical protein